MAQYPAWRIPCQRFVAAVADGFSRMTRGQCGSLFLHCAGLAPAIPCRSPGALRSSNLFGRASKLGTYRTNVSPGECSRDSQETLQTPFVFQIGHRPSKRTCHGCAMLLLGLPAAARQASRARSKPPRCSSGRYRSRVCLRAPPCTILTCLPSRNCQGRLPSQVAVAARRHHCAHANGSHRSRHLAPWRGVAIHNQRGPASPCLITSLRRKHGYRQVAD